MEVDERFKEVGEFGIWQKKLTIVMLIIQAYISFHTVQTVLVGAKPEHILCVYKGNIFENCSMACEKYLYTGDKYQTIAHEWNLVCDQKYKIALSASIYMGGLMIGVFIFGILSDKYGRRLLTLLTLVLSSISLLMTAFSYSFYIYTICRFLDGFFSGGLTLVSFVLLAESVGSSVRGTLGILTSFAFAIGICIFGPIAYFVTNWRVLIIITSFPGIISAYLYLTLLESPRWLISKNRQEEAKNVFMEIARRNNKNISDLKLIAPTSYVNESNKCRDVTIFQVLKVGIMRKRLLIQGYAWFVNSLVYYGFTLKSGAFSSNVFLNESLSGIVEIPAYILTLLLINRLGRRLLYCLMLFLASLSCFILIFLPNNNENNLSKTVFACLGKLSISASFSVAYVYTAELFPTIIRNNLMGICSVCARIGGMIAPLISYITINGKDSFQWVIFSSVTIIAALLSFMLTDTTNKPTIDSLDDVIKEKENKQSKFEVTIDASVIENNETVKLLS